VARTRAFRRQRNWRVGIEARVSHLKRAFGLRRTRLRRLGGARAWVGRPTGTSSGRMRLGTPPPRVSATASNATVPNKTPIE
jgi:hypothetical protein